MKKVQIFFIAACLLLNSLSLAKAFENGPLLNLIKKTTHEKIVKWAKDPIIVSAVKEANKKAIKSTDEIAKFDELWKATEGIDEWIGGFINNACADYLRGFQDQREGRLTTYPEIFIMDKQGCIVAETSKTSDYWQGDEDKFIKSFAGGKGMIFIDEPSFDESTRRYVTQVSVPIFDSDTRTVIGAMTVGIDLDALGEQAIQ